MQRTRGRKRAGSSSAPTRLGGVARARQLDETNELSDAEMERALIAGLLEDELGSEFVNDAAFQKLADDVVAIVRDDETTKALLKSALAQIRLPAP